MSNALTLTPGNVAEYGVALISQNGGTNAQALDVSFVDHGLANVRVKAVFGDEKGGSAEHIYTVAVWIEDNELYGEF